MRRAIRESPTTGEGNTDSPRDPPSTTPRPGANRPARTEEYRRRARTYLREHASLARKTVGGAIHPGRRRFAESLRSGPDEAPTANSTSLVRELQQELRDERRTVLVPLLHRMSELGRRLNSGQRVPPKVIEEGLDLWQIYVARLHDVHVGQFVAARTSIPHVEACSLPLVQIEQEPGRAETRIDEMRSMLLGYEGRPQLYRALMGLTLFGNATAELSWEGFEEDFANTCLPDHLTPTALRQWQTSLIETRAVAQATRRKVEDYLDRTAEYALPESTAPAKGPDGTPSSRA